MKVKIVGGIVLIALAWFAFQGCSSASPDRTLESTATLLSPGGKNVVRATNQLGFDLLKIQSPQPGNLVVCPAGVAQALAVLAKGAKGKTLAQIEKLVGTTALEGGDKALKGLHDVAQNADERASLRVGNAIWYDKSIPIANAFKAAVSDNLRCELHPIDSGSSASQSQLDQWISGQTGGKIGRSTRMITGDTAFLLTSTVSFRGEWADRFDTDQTGPGDFYVSEDKPVRTTFMRGLVHERFNPHWEAGFIRAISFGNGRFELVIIEPDDLDSFVRTTSAVESENLTKGLESYDHASSFEFPKFTINTRVDLRAGLGTVGMKDAFSMLDADFAGMSSQRLFVMGAEQMTTFEVDEEGVEAASNTELEGAAAGGSQINAPFMFAVWDSKTGAILFLGIYRKPE